MNANGPFFHEFRESEAEKVSIEGSLEAAVGITGALKSPFKLLYPIQKPSDPRTPGNAGELRGFYRRSDGQDRWKPSWSRFGHPRNGRTHQGVDIYAPIGTEVVAIVDGYAMLYPTPAPGDELGIKAGITFTGEDGKKYDVLYGHLSQVNGTSRQVKKGDVIGKTGCTGNAEDGACSTANKCGGHTSHLHLAIRESVSGATYKDPVAFFGFRVSYENDIRDVPCEDAW